MNRRNFDMRKIAALAALLITAFSLAACKNSNDEEYQRPRNIETPPIYNDMPPKGSIGN
jgi:hypothetical protein